MKQNLHVEAGNYDIEISDNSFEKLMQDINALTCRQKRLFVISKKVYNLYKTFLNITEDELLILPDGEKEKNISNYIKILETSVQRGLTRNDVMIAIGGGVIGDLTGFAASTYMRGIDYIQVPTTLLAMVDSSVGGKTAIDLKSGKNLAGTFYQPKAVLININFLKTLDKKQYMSGLGEVLKYAFIENVCGYSQQLFVFDYLTLCRDQVFDYDSVTIIRIIDYCLKLKIAVVNKDEKESSLRRVLNFGHTLGHALETATNYRKYTHGEAVVLGIFFALNIAYKTELITYSYYRQSIELLEKYGFRYFRISKKFNPEKLINLMKKDKKAQSDGIVFILPCDKKAVKIVKLSPKETGLYLDLDIKI